MNVEDIVQTTVGKSCGEGRTVMPDRDITIWGDTNHGERILIRIIEPNRPIKAVPADERSISGPAYNQDRECENESCSNVFGVPQKYEDNRVFCSIECAEEVS